MYNAHRGMQPVAPGPAPNTRLMDLLEQIRAEFESQGLRTNDNEESLMNQHQEMVVIKGKIDQLQNTYEVMKRQLEEENTRLRRELESRGGLGQSHAAHPHAQPPPSLGHGHGNLFQGIMAGNTAQGGPGLAPPPAYAEGHAQQGPPPYMGGPAAGAPAQAAHQAQFPPHAQPGSAVNGYGSQGALAAASPVPKTRPAPRGHGGPATPQLNSANPYSDSPAYQARGTPPPANGTRSGHEDVGNELVDLNGDKLPAELKHEGDDWYAYFNPKIPRALDVELVHNLAHNSVVCCVRFSRDGRYVATGCNRSAQIYDVETGREVSFLADSSVAQDGADLYIRSVCFSPDGHQLATGAEDRVIRVWDIRERAVRHRFTGHEQDIYSLDYSPDGRFIASGSGDRSVRLWDIPRGECVLKLDIEDGVTTVSISPDGNLLAAGSLDKSVRVWNMHDGSLLERLEATDTTQGHADSVYSVAFSPSSRELVSGSLDKTIMMWQLQNHSNNRNGAPQPRSGKCIKTFQGHKDFVLSVAQSPDGAWVMSGSKDRGVQFWDPVTGDAQFTLQGHKNSVISVAPSPTPGGLFATGSGDMRARVWRYFPYRA